MNKILLVDDDRDLVDLLEFAFRRAGFTALTANDAPAALKLLEQQPDLAVLDINLGQSSGFDLLETVRQRSAIPVIMLTARDAEDDKVRGLDLGADDYVTKPFGHRELIARIRAHLRRQGQNPVPSAPLTSELRVGPLVLNQAAHSVTNNGQPVDLTVTEFRLLSYLMLNAGTVIPSQRILRQVWGYSDPTGIDVVRVTVHRLRRKLEVDPTQPRLLQTIPGVGLILRADP